jgi:hypothetical protein
MESILWILAFIIICFSVSTKSLSAVLLALVLDLDLVVFDLDLDLVLVFILSQRLDLLDEQSALLSNSSSHHV